MPTVVDILAGTCGGIAVTFVGHPMDTVKVRLQTQPQANPVYSGVADCVTKTIKWEGFPGLYKGVMSPLVGQMFFRSTMFAAFAGSKEFIRNQTGRELSTADFFIAGGMTGFASSFVEGPIDFYKTQLQIQIIRSKTIEGYKPAYTGLLDVAKKTWATNGVKAPFQGLTMTIIRNVPANAVYLGFYELFKNTLAERQKITVQEIPLFQNFLAGGVAGVLYWVAVFPLDVIKSAIMGDAVRPSERKFRGMADATRALMAEGGISRFYRGFTPCMIRYAFSPVVSLSLLDKSFCGGCFIWSLDVMNVHLCCCMAFA
ncbi:hypothetical protein SARC_05777 [Sphaeroforma arctica JP610]|uniref:Uncharacterized protein n=1 Tax=Sphaeroforma arctica JP610 TaxID=667725 RepID=A0A0L0FZD8_9EUKA|nr:hypothetical protein SARC_05777 [Sphaeroforma arctica JP610]KNC81926.1 hypothetical protein SARC_05777 [Sphaeroforma arctica JP610]|eukprot:XP_014155828.1 hypothetical protein SARC_05777 [Sphaeroforma arctica JP610]